jgi:peptide/nickel transport system permease protein
VSVTTDPVLLHRQPARRRPWGPFVPAAAILIPIVLAALLAPILPLPDPVTANFALTSQPPSALHWFGTDDNGMDIFSRVIFATRIDLLLALTAVAVGASLGTLLGAVAGYVGGFLENVIERGSEMVQGFPYILFGLMIAMLMGTGQAALIVVVAVYNIPFYAKLVRTEVKSLRDSAFIRAAICGGVRPPMIVIRHLVPNALPAIIGQLPLSAASAIRFVAALSFLGLGIPPPTPEWGSMIRIGANSIIFGKWWISGFPGLALFAVVWALNSGGSALQALIGREQ